MHATSKRTTSVAVIALLLGAAAVHLAEAADKGPASDSALDGKHDEQYKANSSFSSSKDNWAQHPAVFTLQQLGLWRTIFHGLVESEKHQHKSSHAIQLHHWWSCRPQSNDRVELRGTGHIFPAVDPHTAELHVTIPSYMNEHWAAVKLIDMKSQKPANLTQSKLHIGGINAWHVGASGLPSDSSYTLTTASTLSKHSYSWDSSRCSNTPSIIKPGSMWTVTIQAGHVDMSLYASLVAEHTSYYQTVGFTGAILFMSRTNAAALVKQPKIKEGMDEGFYVFVIWDEDVVPTMPYYYQYMWYNIVVLATWGVPGVKLAMIDLDEFYILPKDLTFTKALQPGGCLYGYHQFMIYRYNTFFGLTAAEAAACNEAAKKEETTKKGNDNQQKKDNKHKHKTGHRRIRAASDVKLHDMNTTLGKRESLKRSLPPDMKGLTSMGWRKYLQQQQGQPTQSPKQGLELLAKHQEMGPAGQSSVGYIDRYMAAGNSKRWARKSFVDPNYVGAYAVHETSYLLPGTKSTSEGVSSDCAFGIHLENMYRFRSFGSGEQMVLSGSKGLFNLSDHLQHLDPQ